MARRETRADPFVQSSYYVDLVVDGDSVGYFGKVTGGSISLTVIEYTLNQYGGSQGIYIPGATAFEPVTLSQGVGTDMAFWKWWVAIANGTRHTALRLNASIFAYGPLTVGTTSTEMTAATAEKTAVVDDATTADVDETQAAEAAGVITMEEAKGLKKYAEWTLTDVWPSKITGFNFAATGDRTFGMSVTLMVEEITRVQ